MLLSFNCSIACKARSRASPYRNPPVLICGRGHDVLAHGETAIKQPEMSNCTIILLLVHHPLFYFYQTIVGPFDFVQYLLCLSVSYAVCEVTCTFRSFDVLANAQ